MTNTNNGIQNWLPVPVAFSLALMLAACGGHEKTGETSAQSDAGAVPTVVVARVEKHKLDRVIKLTGELLAFRDVPIYPKVKGFVKWINVDRGSKVKAGEKIIRVYAPELEDDTRRAESQVQAARAALSEANFKMESAVAQLKEGEAERIKYEATAERMEKAARVPGVVAKNDVEIARKTADAYDAKVHSLKRIVEAQEASIKESQKLVQARNHELAALQTMQSYLEVKAPFDGVITERNVHEGSLVSSAEESTITSFSSNEAASASGSATPSCMVRVRQNDKLRLVVPVPEVAVAGIKPGDTIPFTVPAYPEKKFFGQVARKGNYLDRNTRTMPVELDVANSDEVLQPGMFPEIEWRVTRPYETLFVPESSVVMSLERTFAVRIKDGAEDVVDVTRGQPMGSSLEVLNTQLKAGDEVALRASEDMKTGRKAEPKLASTAELEAVKKRTSSGGE